MPWLQYELCHAYGYSLVAYVEIIGEGVSEHDVQEWVIDTHSDGMRRPRFTVLEHLPPKVLEERIKQCETERDGLTEEIMRLKSQRR